MPILDNSIVIADYDYFPMLLRYKGQNKLNIKLMTKDDLIDKIGLSFKEDPIPFMLKLGIEYNKAKKFIKLLRIGNINNSEKLLDLYNKLKDYITTDSYGEYELRKYNIYLFEMEEDNEAKALLKRHNLEFTYLTLDEVGSAYFSDTDHPDIFYFENKFLQYFYIYSDIKKKLNENPDAKSQIQILINDDADIFYTELFSKAFNIPSFAVVRKPMIGYKSVKDKVSDIYDKKEFIFTEDELEIDEIRALKKLVDKYDLYNIDFNNAYPDLLEILASNTFRVTTSDRGIIIKSDYTFSQTPYIYVTNFQFGAFYRVYDDNNVLFDDELVKCELNPSYVKTLLDRRKKRNFIYCNNIVFLSRVKQHLNDSIYDSHFIEELKWKKDITEKTLNKDGLYTEEAKRLYHTYQMDKVFYNKELDGLKGYDHSFKGINGSIHPDGKTWSITNLEQYINCPFKYYLDTIMPITNDDFHARFKGTMIHSILEHINREDFDFDALYNEAEKEYIKGVEELGLEFDGKERTWLDIIKYWLKPIILKIRETYNIVKIVRNNDDAEQKILFTLNDNNESYEFKGYIDKIIWSHDSKGNIYYTIIDYKTGAESFRPKTCFLGKSVQLPLYYYAIEQNPNRDKYANGGTFGGFGIQKPYFKSLKDAFVDNDGNFSYDNLAKETRIKGVSKASLDYWYSFDESGIKVGKKNEEDKLTQYGGNLLYKGMLFNEVDSDECIIDKVALDRYNLEDSINDSIDAMLKAIKNIKESKFEIAPSSPNIEYFDPNRLFCAFCGHKDICYHSKSDAKDYTDKINEKFPKEVK